MTKIQERITEIKAEIASYGDTGKYGEGRWWYYTVKRLEDELKELEDELLAIHMDSLTFGYKK